MTIKVEPPCNLAIDGTQYITKNKVYEVGRDIYEKNQYHLVDDMGLPLKITVGAPCDTIRREMWVVVSDLNWETRYLQLLTNGNPSVTREAVRVIYLGYVTHFQSIVKQPKNQRLTRDFNAPGASDTDRKRALRELTGGSRCDYFLELLWDNRRKYYDH